MASVLSTSLSLDRAAVIPRLKRLGRLKPRSPREWFLLGIGGLTAILVSLALLLALSYRPFESTDENEHVSYALDVSHGFLPTLSTLVRPEIHGMHPGWTYTANHPPLFYFLEAVPLRAGISLGHPEVGFFAGRLLNIAIAAAGLLAVVWLARIVVPHRRSIALVAPVFVAALPLTTAVSGQIYNDAAAVAASTATLACCCRLLLLGPSRGRLIAVATSGLVAASIRATGLGVVVLAIGCAAATVVIHPPRHLRRRTLISSALGTAGFVGALTLAGIGWFYARNARLYGDLTGAGLVVKRFPSPHVPILSALTSARFWLNQYRGLFGRLHLLTGWREALLLVLFFALGAAFAAAATRLVSALRRGSVGVPRLAVLVVLSLHVLACLAILLKYVSIGGAPFPRYLLAAVPVLAIAVAYGIGALRRRHQSVALAFATTSLAGLGIAAMTSELAYRNPSWHAVGGSAITAGLSHNGVPLAAVVAVLMLLLLVTGIALVVTAHSKLVSLEISHATAG